MNVLEMSTLQVLSGEPPDLDLGLIRPFNGAETDLLKGLMSPGYPSFSNNSLPMAPRGYLSPKSRLARVPFRSCMNSLPLVSSLK